MKRHLLAIVAICLCLLAAHSSRSQSLYEVTFDDTTGHSYKCLLVYFNEENSYMRIAYTDNKVYNVVHVDYKSVTGVNGQKANYFYLKGAAPVFITTAAHNGYSADYFIWYGTGAAQVGPYQTDNAGFANQKRVKTYRQLKPEAITDSYLREFFNSQEEKYFAMRKICGLDKTTVTLADLALKTASKMYFIMAANTGVSDIGMSCNIDKHNMENEFSDIAAALKIDFVKYTVSEGNYSKNNLYSILADLHPGKDDIIVFAYSGHGFRWQDQTEKYPMMDLRSSSYANVSADNSANVADVYNMLTGKGARLTLILSDCCNSSIGRNQLTTSGFLNAKSDVNADMTRLQRLFLNARGNVIATAAQPGQYSWGNNASGGFFTSSFIQALREEISYFKTATSSWDAIINRTLELAAYKTSPGVCTSCQSQNGLRYSVVSY